jgi:hypothetical protein
VPWAHTQQTQAKRTAAAQAELRKTLLSQKVVRDVFLEARSLAHTLHHATRAAAQLRCRRC